MQLKGVLRDFKCEFAFIILMYLQYIHTRNWLVRKQKEQDIKKIKFWFSKLNETEKSNWNTEYWAILRNDCDINNVYIFVKIIFFYSMIWLASQFMAYLMRQISFIYFLMNLVFLFLTLCHNHFNFKKFKYFLYLMISDSSIFSQLCLTIIIQPMTL